MRSIWKKIYLFHTPTKKSEKDKIAKTKPPHFTGGSLLKEDFRKACEEAGIENFRFHDLRHVAINNWRKAGHDYFKIMKATGHKTMAVFKRYNTVDDEELKSLAMDTSKESQEIPSHN